VPQTVGSWQLQNLNAAGRTPSSYTLEGVVSGSWTVLDTFNPAASPNIFRTFAPMTVDALRYTATGPNLSGDQFFQLFEMQVFLDATDSQTLYGQLPTGTAYNYLRDRSPVAMGPTTHSIVGSGWTAPDGTLISDWKSSGNGDPVGNVIDGDYDNTFLRDQTTASLTNPYSYVKVSFPELLQMDLAHFGWFDSQDWNNWALYASPLANPNPDIPGDWVSIFQTVPSTGQTELVQFGANAGMYQHILVLFKSGPTNGGALTEIELYGFETPPPPIPEPVSAGAVALFWPLLLLGRRRRARR